MSTLRKYSRYVYIGTSWIELAALFIPIFIAGTALFVRNSFWASHAEFGFTVGLPILLLIVTGITGWIPRKVTAWLVGMTVLHAVHTTLPTFRDSTPLVAAIHPVTAVLLTGVTYYHARLATRLLPDGEQSVKQAGSPAEAA